MTAKNHLIRLKLQTPMTLYCHHTLHLLHKHLSPQFTSLYQSINLCQKLHTLQNLGRLYSHLTCTSIHFTIPSSILIFPSLSNLSPKKTSILQNALPQKRYYSLSLTTFDLFCVYKPYDHRGDFPLYLIPLPIDYTLSLSHKVYVLLRTYLNTQWNKHLYAIFAPSHWVC